MLFPCISLQIEEKFKKSVEVFAGKKSVFKNQISVGFDGKFFSVKFSKVELFQLSMSFLPNFALTIKHNV